MSERDWQRDWDWVNKLPPGPWKRDFWVMGTIVSADGKEVMWGYGNDDGDYIDFVSDEVEEFVLNSQPMMRHYLQRVQELEAMCVLLHTTVRGLAETLRELEQENARLRQLLEERCHGCEEEGLE